MMRESPPRLAASPSRARPRRSRWTLRLLLLAVGLPCGGCNFLEDEFTWLDRRAPSTARAPDAAPSGTEAGH